MFDTVQLLKREGKALVMVEQNGKKGLAAADRGYVMELGRVRLEDRAARLADDPRVAAMYLGRTKTSI